MTQRSFYSKLNALSNDIHILLHESEWNMASYSRAKAAVFARAAGE